jgi:hypothetical protein
MVMQASHGVLVRGLITIQGMVVMP